MGILYKVKSTNIFNEFEVSEQEYWFKINEKKVLPHIDTLYYNVFLNGDIRESISGEIIDFIEVLKECNEKLQDKQEEFWFDEEQTLIYSSKKSGMYNHCISCPSMFDIFIASSVPNDNTPRVHIQIRSMLLWLYGVESSINYTYESLVKILKQFDITVKCVQENRIDYCYHTNVLQDPDKHFTDDKLVEQLEMSFKIGQKVFRWYQGALSYEYLALGDRNSNNTFFRSYNKNREVVEKGYKDFFLDIWLENGLISKYDHYVLNDCFMRKRYDSVEYSMMKFYIEYGKDENIKKRFLELYDKPTTTTFQVRKAIKGVLPYPTQVMNVEFQTMRKFYFTCDDLINTLAYKSNCPKELERLFRIIDNRKIFLDYLTKYTVCFTKDKKASRDDEKKYYTDFWYRIRNVKLDGFTKADLKRNYSKNRNEELVLKRLKGNLASLALYNNSESDDILVDMSYLMARLNDNDMKTLEDGTIKLIDKDYTRIKNKKMRALKSYVKQPNKSL